MNSSDLQSIFIWWGVLVLLTIISLPLTTSIFKDFFDRGYIFSKIIGILLVSYFSWLISSIRLLDFQTSIFISPILLLIINIFWIKKTNFIKVLKSQKKIFLIEEIIFLTGLLFWSFIKSHEPSIHGLEKFMDFGFINSISITKFFPPKDIWLTPHFINYYYFGHLTAAVLTKLSSLNSIVTYNLMLATLFGLTLSGSFSIGLNLFSRYNPTSKVFKYFCGGLAAFLVTMGGNLHTIYIFFANYPVENPVPFWSLGLMSNFSGYWYPNATRFIPNTIHEFPLYSFVVSDLHGHVFNIPYVLLFLAIILKIYLDEKPFQGSKNIFYLLTLGFFIGIFLMTNVLDGPIYLLLITILLLIKKAEGILIKLFLVLSSSILFSLPFWLEFKPFASGIGVLCAPSFLTSLGKVGPLLFEADHCMRSPWWMLMILWGFFYFAILVFLVTVSGKGIRKFYTLHPIDRFSLILSIFATILIIIPELVYAKDIYPAHYRANTVFKFGYQAFMILGLVSSYMITRFIQNKFSLIVKKSTYFVLALVMLFLFSLVAIYPFFAIRSYFGELKNYQGLDGLKYLSTSSPDDYKAILWARDNLKNQPVILEAQGDSYTDYARVSANTGFPTVVGWPVHEWLWRGSYDEPGKRIPDVTSLYETEDEGVFKSLIDKYKIEYIFLGSLEKQKYPNLKTEKFDKLGEKVFEASSTAIYKIKNN